MTEPSAKPKAKFSLLALVLLATLPWLPMLNAPLMTEERILFFEAWKWIGIDPAAPWTMNTSGSGTWRPLSAYAFRMDAGMPAWISHLFNITVHLIFVLLAHSWFRTRLSQAAAFTAAAILGTHASHVAVASWIAGRADLLMGICALLSLMSLDRGRWVSCGLFAGVAILFKETGIGLIGMLGLIAWLEKPEAAKKSLLFAGLMAGTLFALSIQMSELPPGYLPSLAGLTGASFWLPFFIIELITPWFQPVGVLSGGPDLILFAGAAGIAFIFVRTGHKKTNWLLGVGLGLVSLLPVAHVLQNGGGQWYLFLPSLGFALAWGVIAEAFPFRIWPVLILSFAAVSTAESMAWRKASIQIDQIIEAAKPRAIDKGPENLKPPPAQNPAEWPHRGPSFCCGFPWQIFQFSGDGTMTKTPFSRKETQPE